MAFDVSWVCIMWVLEAVLGSDNSAMGTKKGCCRVMALWYRCLLVLSLVEARETLLLKLARVLYIFWADCLVTYQPCERTSARVALHMIRDIFSYPPSKYRLQLATEWVLAWTSTITFDCLGTESYWITGAGLQWESVRALHEVILYGCKAVVRSKAPVSRKLRKITTLLDCCEYPFVPVELKDIRDRGLRLIAVRLLLGHAVQPPVVILSLLSQIVA